MPLFRALPDDFIDRLRERVELVQVEPGAVICSQGDPSDRLWLIRVGFVKVSQDYSIWKQVVIQAEGVLISVVVSAVVAFIAYKIVDMTIGLRVPGDEQREGLDITSHGETAYSK